MLDFSIRFFFILYFFRLQTLFALNKVKPTLAKTNHYNLEIPYFWYRLTQIYPFESVKSVAYYF